MRHWHHYDGGVRACPRERERPIRESGGYAKHPRPAGWHLVQRNTQLDTTQDADTLVPGR
jgi:hypothetical protein